MDNPKISVLVPIYNRKHYIAQCLDSALNQTFKDDYEIIVRDDGSSDGSADFVEQRYAAAIASGKLKLRRNEKNIGEFSTDNRLLREATGKYIMILHSDDMYLPHALEHMYSVAEHFQADVVHGTVHLTTNADGLIKQGTTLKIHCHDSYLVNKVTLMSDNLIDHFNEWEKGGTFIDAQHNIFRREFIMNNALFFGQGGNRIFAMRWIMKAKVLVKTPLPFYVYRNSPDSVTRAKFPPERVAGFIHSQIELSRWLDEYFAGDDFFKDNPDFQHRARNHLFLAYDNHWINRNGVYKDGVTPELHRAVERAFRKYFGDDAAFPTFLFHWIHAAMFGKPVDVTPPHSINRTKKNIPCRKLRRGIFFAIMWKIFLQ